MSISVLTIVKNRQNHLAQLVEGLRRSTQAPLELVIVDMASDTPVRAIEAPFAIHVIRHEGRALPLAAARNAAAQAAAGDQLLFLDVDCIPMRGLVSEMAGHLGAHDALICGQAFYLGPQDARGEWDEAKLLAIAKSHPARTFPKVGVRPELNAGLFWSLIFGIGRNRFLDLGGFDEAFTGYGAEDTDFGFRARKTDLPLFFMGGAGAFHQYHDVCDPPLQHLHDIVRNANLFHDRWDFWPMEGWLKAFASGGYIMRTRTGLEVIREPSAAEIVGARVF